MKVYEVWRASETGCQPVNTFADKKDAIRFANDISNNKLSEIYFVKVTRR